VKARRQEFGKPRFDDFSGCRIDIVVDPKTVDPTLLDIENDITGARVSIARLTYAPHIGQVSGAVLKVDRLNLVDLNLVVFIFD
jgi:hypothetical protein